MSRQKLIHGLEVSRLEVGANDALLLTDRDVFYVVESGHVGLFATVVDDRDNVQSRKPFIANISAGNAFFGGSSMPVTLEDNRGSFVFLAVPSRDTVLLRGRREQLFSPDPDDSNLDSIILIDDWVAAGFRFVARHEPPIPRAAHLLEADPDVRYEASSVLGAHHLEILWVWADRPTEFIGLPEFAVPSGAVLPLSEHVWLTLPEETLVSAVHTPGAIVGGKLLAGLERYHLQILQCAKRVWLDHHRREDIRHDRNQRSKTRLLEGMVRDLHSVLLDTRPTVETQEDDRGALHAAAAIVAEAAGVTLADSSANSGDPLVAVGPMVAPSGIRTRQIDLPAGWERKDGPSFLGLVSGEKPRPVAVVNRGGGTFEMIDPANGETARVNRARARSLESRGVMFYPPLAPGVNSGLGAVLQALRGRGRDIFIIGLMGALSAVVALLIPILTGELLAEIIPRIDIPMWIAALAGMAIGAFVTLAVSIVGAFGMLRIEARIDETLQAAIWNRLLSLPLPFFRQYIAGDLADRANGVSAIRQLLTGAVGNSLVSGVFSVFSYLLLFYYSWELALWAGVAVLLLAGGSWFFAARQIGHQRAVFAAQGAIDGLMFQIILALPKIRQANAEINVLKRWSEQYANQRREQLSARKWAAGQLTFNAFFTPVSQLALLAMIWYMLIGTGSETANAFSLADFLSFNAAFAQFVAGVTGLAATWTTVIAILPLFERVLPIIEAQPENADGTVLTDISGRIECEHVAFRYPEAARDTVQGVSFHIEPGEYVAFLGPSGAGKSTLYRLLLGFEQPSSGTVLLDGHDLLSLDLGAMRRHFGVVLQNGQLVPDSIGGIIAGDAPLSQREIWEAARMVGLEEEIEALPMGMKTVVSEGGTSLSGGQRQRLLVARALARKPRVLLFDEPTSMLDNRAQETIRATLRRMAITRILIAHRLSTVVDVDRVYVMQGGRIVESGSYQALMNENGVLAKMAARQIV